MLAVVMLPLAAGCSLGEGDGAVASDNLFVSQCWDGPFDLGPNFFAAVPFQRTLSYRVQKGGDIEEVSDGMTVLVDDIDAVRANLGTPMAVGLPIGVSIPGVPIVAQTNPPLLHATLYLNRACFAQNSVLYAISGSMTFHSIFSGDPNESSATEKLTDAEFSEIDVADPRDSPAGMIAPRHVSKLHGFFRFYFQRGQPGQPFP
jgi:hypothetical protein